MFALGIDFITGVAVMTDAASRERAEWPPHPARIYMALVAAHYESRPLLEDGVEAAAAWDRERTALQWLEQQGAPEMHWPAVSVRSVVKVYVPVNDSSTPKDAQRVKAAELRGALGVLPELRSRQERTFPAVRLQDEDSNGFVSLIWPSAAPTAEIVDAMSSLCAKVVRIGHSASLVRVWVSDCEIVPEATYAPNCTATKGQRGLQLRIPGDGFLSYLDQRYNGSEIEEFFDISERIETSSGKAKQEAKREFATRFGREWSRTTSAPVRQRPVAGLTACYGPKVHADRPPLSTDFDPDLFVLSKLEGPVLGLETTATLTTALRGLLLQNAEDEPEWFTGHSAPGAPSTNGHMALLPLSYVSSEHADGHVMGLALAFPRNVSTVERAKALRGRLFGTLGEDLDLMLQLGPLGVWTMRREERSSPPLALRSTTWTDPSTVWASVTPVVLDRHPKRDRRSEHAQWREEVVLSIARSCELQGLPQPKLIDVDKTSWHRGAPRSHPGPGGMPWLPGKEGAAPRQQVHVLIEFPSEVQGPLLLGAGRFRGYGLLKPLGPK